MTATAAATTMIMTITLMITMILNSAEKEVSQARANEKLNPSIK